MSVHSIARIRDVAVFLKGKKPSFAFEAPNDGALPYVLIENFNGRYTSYTNDPACVRCRHSDTIVVADGANTGLASTNHEGYIGSTLGALRPTQSKVHPRYLFFFVQGHFNTLNTRTRGAAVPHLEKELLFDLELPLPPLAEQERIVRILDEAEALRRLRANSDAQAIAIEAALFQKFFGSPAANPREWKVVSVGDLFDAKRGGVKCGPFGSALKKDEYSEKGVPVWGIPNVLPNHFVESGSLFIPREKFLVLQAYAVEPGDILISRAGTVGRICVARPQAKESIIGTNLIRLTLDKTRILPEFFAALLTHFASEVGQLRADSSETSYSFMSTTVLKSLCIYLPPIELQERYVSSVAEVRELQDAQAASRQRLDDLFQTLLHHAFQGEL